MTTKKRNVQTHSRASQQARNTGLFYGYLKRIPGYDPAEAETIKGGVVESYLVGKYGTSHGRRIGLTSLTDAEYDELLADLKRQVNVATDTASLKAELNEKAVRKDWCHRIFKQLARIGVSTLNGYDDANRHIQSLPISRGRILPAIPLDELPVLYKAVCSYCDNRLKKQRKEQAAAERN